jgi:hypothetical protein
MAYNPGSINLQDTTQNLIVSNFYSRYRDRIVSGVHVHYMGGSAGSEFLTYAATKMYLAFRFNAGYSVTTMVANKAFVTFYNDADAIQFYGQNGHGAWDTTAAAFRYNANNYEINTIDFSRVAFTGYNYIMFDGYRVTLL